MVSICEHIQCGYSNAINHPFLLVGIPPIYGDDWGMVYYCYTNISMLCNTRSEMNNTGYIWFYIMFYILVGGKPTPLKNMSQ